MSVPQPSSPLKGHCAAIDSDVLYVYDEDKLQSLPLKKNATWSDQSYGQSVTNPACVRAVPNGDEASAALYVVGGDTNDGGYLGLQRYFFGNDTWETLQPLADVLQTRTNHSVAYLNDSQSILVYGGSTPDAPSLLSSQTFLLSTQPPYVINSFISDAPPTNNAILTPWNSSHAVMVGGTATNTDVWLFGPDEGWSQLPTNLSEPLNDASRAVIVDGSDGSKVLQVYKFHVSPNTAEGIVLLGAGGAVAETGVTVGNNSSSSEQRKRDLTLNDWPSYNSSNAPTSIRTDCSISRSADGLTIMAGGNHDNPVALFDQNDNSWIDADRFFDSKQQQPLLPSSTSTPSSAATPTATPTESTPAILGNGSAHDRTMRTLGITLGTLCGIAAVFILILLYLRWRKLKAKKANGGYLEEKDGEGRGERMSFQDRGTSFMKEAGISNTDLVPPNNPYGANHNSHSSLAIIAGKFGNNKRYTGAHHSAKGSFESTTHLVKDREGNLVPSENLEMMDIGDKTPNRQGDMLAVPGAVAHGSSLNKETRAERKRSSGWSKYFATSAPTGPNGLSHIPSVYVKPNTLSVGSRYSQDERTPSQESRIPSSALVPPLDIDFSKAVDGQRLSHVAQGSPVVSDSREAMARQTDSIDIPEAQRGVIVDPADPRKSQATSISSYGNRSTLGSTVSSDFYEQMPWTPMSGGNFKDHLNDRPSSSVYTNSIHDPKERRPSRGKGAGFFPGAGTNYRPQKVKMSHAAGPSSDWASPAKPVMPAARAEQNRDSAASNITVFPGMKDFDETPKKENKGSQPTAPGAAQRQSNLNADMSWLNLGLNKNQHS